MNKIGSYAPCRMSMDIFVVESRFCGAERALKIFLKKGLTKPVLRCIITEYNKEEPPLSPARRLRVWLITLLARIGSWVVCRAERNLCTVIFYSFYPMEVLKISSAKDNKETLLNEDIVAPEIRLIGPEGEALGIMPPQKALAIAYDKGLDLVMMAAQATPPVCKIMDYGKFCFERDKREKEAKKKQQTIEVKEIQLSYRIDVHDFETKKKHALRFLGDGNKVRVVMRFRGREMSHISIGKEVLERFRDACSEVGSVDKAPVLDNRTITMIINPVKK